MTLAQEIYESLLKDPDLEVGENQTREEFAKQEAEHRARQHYNNVEALALANQPLKEETPVINLLQYVKNISKTINTSSVSIVQDIIKALKGTSVGQILGQASEKQVHDLPTYNTLFDKVGANGKAFLNSLANAKLPPKYVVGVLNAIEKDAKNNPHDFLDDTWAYDFISHISDNPKVIGGTGGLNAFHNELLQHDNFSSHVPYTEHKPESILDKNTSFYGTNESHKLATAASVDKVNNLLSAAGHKAQVEFGQTGKLKLVGVTPKYNPHSGKTEGRLYGSMTQEKAPNKNYNTAQSDAITQSNINDFSVADILNGVNWLLNKKSSTPKNTVAEDFHDDVKSATQFEEKASSKLPPNQIGETKGDLAKGKPHVVFGGWGHKDFGKKGKQHIALKQALSYGLCNEKGQLNTIGHVLMQDAYDKGVLGSKEVYEQDSHVMLKSAGIDKLLEHHGVDITNGQLLPSVIAENIANMELAKEDMPDVDWDELNSKIAGQVPEGGVPETEALDNLVLDTADNLNVSPTPPEPDTKDGYIAKMKSHAIRANAAINSGDTVSAKKHKDLLVNTIDKGNTELGDDLLPAEVQETIIPQIDSSNQKNIIEHLSDNLEDKTAAEELVSMYHEDEPVSPSEQTQATEDVTTVPDEAPSTPTPTTAPVSKPQDVNIASLMDKHNDVIEHMYEQTYGKDNEVTSLEEFKADKAEDFAEMGTKKAKHELAVGHNKMKASKQKEAEKQAAKEEKETVKQQAIADKEKQAKIAQEAKEEQAKTIKEEKEKIIQDKQKQKEANVLPSQAGDLGKIAGKDEDGNLNELPDGIATLHAMQLAAHQKQYKDHMTPKTQDKLKEAMIDAQDMGADMDEVFNTLKEKGDDFGSPEHMKELHNKAVKEVEFHQNHKDLISGESDASKQAIEDAMKHGSHGTFTEMDEDGKPATYKDHPDYEKHKDADNNLQSVVDKAKKITDDSLMDSEKTKVGQAEKLTAHLNQRMQELEDEAHKTNKEIEKSKTSLQNAKDMKETAEAKLKKLIPAGHSEEADKERAEHEEMLTMANERIHRHESKLKGLETGKKSVLAAHAEHQEHIDNLKEATQGAKDFNSFKEAHHDEESKKEQSKQHHILHTLDPIQQKHADALKQAQKHNDKEGIAKAAAALKESGVPEEDIHHMAEDGTKKDEPTGDGPPDPDVARKKMAEGYVWHKETRHWILKETLQNMKGGHGGFDASIVSGGHQGKGGGAFALDEHGNSSNKNFLFHGSGGLLGIGDGKSPKSGSISSKGIAGNAIHNILSQGGHLDNHEASGKGMTKLQNFTHPDPEIGGGAGNSGLHHLNEPDAKPSGMKAQFKAGQKEGFKGADKIKGAVKIGAKILDPTGISQAKFAGNVIASGGKKGGGYLKDFISDKIASHKGKKFYGFEKSDDMTALSLLLEQYNPQDHLKHKRKVEDLLDSLSNDEEQDEKRLEKSIITI